MDHGTYRELAAGAALDDLDPAERASLDAHVATCASCGSDARALRDTAGMLTYAVPRRVPPASLRGGVLAAIAASERRPVGVPAATLAYAGAIAGLPASGARHDEGRNGTVPAPAVATRGADAADLARGADAAGATRDADPAVVELAALRRERTRYRRLSFAGLAAAAALAIAVGALGANAAGMRDDLETATRERDAAVAQLATSDQAMAVVLAPDHATATLTPDPRAGQATVYVVYRPGTPEAWLMAGDLPPTPPGKVYQLWSADAAGVHALTTFTCDGGHACMAPFGVDLAAAKAAMITLEPDGGARGEPGPQVAFGELQG
jgi:Anti-sigma-K factor rskA, C-terminal/Putative zinc-finger